MEKKEEEEEKWSVAKGAKFIVQGQNRSNYALNISRLLPLLLVKVD
jgi:hypothetical protein